MTAFEQIKEHIVNKKSFVLEAGAGSGKTYTLIQTLNFLIENYSKQIQYNNQKIVCITYTNVAKNEIINRLEHNPLVAVSTIHEFFWDCIKSYQKQLKIELCKLNEIRFKEEADSGKEHRYLQNLSERIKTVDFVFYDDTAFRDFERGQLHHDDVIVLSKMMFESNPLLTNILSQKYPYILVDEYQDTSEDTIIALIEFLLERNKNKVLLGFYGDSHQKIYDIGVGDLEKYYLNENTKKIELVKKEENYRSSKEVIGLLNNFRTNIRQIPQKDIDGSVRLIYCNNYPSKEKKGTNGRSKDETITEYEKRIEPLKNQNYDNIIHKLSDYGWDFAEDSQDKILVLANSRVAKRAGFGGLYEVFNKRYGQRTKEKLLDRGHPLIRFFVGYPDKKTSQERETGVEHLMQFWNTKNNNEILRFLKKYSNVFYNASIRHKHKQIISKALKKIENTRGKLTIGFLYSINAKNNIIRLPAGLSKFIERTNADLSLIVDETEKERIIKDRVLFNSFMNLPYQEIINFFEHIQNHTVFSTKHGTKGEEYRNVLTVIDDTEWKQQYNFEKFFDDSDDKEDRKIRTRNLFYVECSRAEEDLTVLVLSEINSNALNTLKRWFGERNLVNIDEFIKS
jgi:Superfamily I DNA and RNA helicases